MISAQWGAIYSCRAPWGARGAVPERLLWGRLQHRRDPRPVRHFRGVVQHSRDPCSLKALMGSCIALKGPTCVEGTYGELYMTSNISRASCSSFSSKQPIVALIARKRGSGYLSISSGRVQVSSLTVPQHVPSHQQDTVCFTQCPSFCSRFEQKYNLTRPVLDRVTIILYMLSPWADSITAWWHQ